MQNQSQFDPSRKTVGTIYRDAQINGDKTPVTNGDLTNELMSSLVEDINDTIKSLPYGEKPFYLTVHEKKDLQMPRAINREIITTLYRPYPEDDTVVFWVDPQSNVIKYCWCLPHWTEMDNMLENEGLFDANLIKEIRAWKQVDLWQFGFCKDDMGNWMANPNYDKDEIMDHKGPSVSILLPSKIGL